MLPLEVLIALPVPFLLALVLQATYYLLPLLHLLPRPTPLLLRLTSLIPNPRRRTRNLPREFFNLPPRATSPNCSISSITSLTMGSALGVRGKVMLVMAGQATVSLIAGWIYLATGATGRAASICLALSTIPLPCGIATITLFSAFRRPHHTARHELSLFRSAIFGSGGVTHSTIIPRILPYSSIATGVICTIAIIPSSAGMYLLVMASLLSVLSVGMAVMSLKTENRTRRGMIRLASPSPDMQHRRQVESSEEYKDFDSMISSPSRTPTPHSAFSYSPSIQTPHTARSSSHTQSDGVSEYDTPKTSLTEYTATPSTVASWDFTLSPTPSLPTPSSALTRPRSPALALPELASPRPVPRGSNNSTVGHSSLHTVTLTSTPGSALGTPGGSIIAGYSPDPFHPMPRGFESLTAVPLTPSQLASRASLAERTNRSTSGFAFVPSQVQRSPGNQGRESTWTLESYHSLSYQTPKSQVRGRSSDDSRRAPPPPPLPYPMPLPPTPTIARSEMAWDQGSSGAIGKDSTELLMGGEREWDMVDLSDEGEGLESWGSGSRGVWMLALAGMLFCVALSSPILAIGLTQTTQVLYLISILLPSALLVLATYILRPRALPTPTLPRNLKKSSKASKASTSTHQSLALRTESQLSLPCTISPKLTPPGRQGPNIPLGEKWDKLLEPKPSISNLGYQAPVRTPSAKGHRRHTVYGALDARDVAAEDNMRKTLARRSVDIWLEAGHAKPAGNMLERAAEMIRPHPALRVLDGPKQSTGDGVMRKLRGGVVSMLLLPKRYSQAREEGFRGVENVEMATPRRGGRYADALEEEDEEPQSPITIHITSPSKFERRQSRLAKTVSGFTEDGEGEGEMEVGNEMDGQIQTATRARMSASPTYFFGKERSEYEGDDCDLDWLQSAILPQLISGIKIPQRSHHVRPSEQFADAETPRIDRRRLVSLRRSSIGGGASPPQLTITSQSPSIRRELRHKHSFSLPLIDKASFSDLRSQVHQVGKDRQHDWSIYADEPYGYDQAMIDFSAAPSGAHESGVDLPAFPIDFTRALPETPESGLSRVDEEGDTRMSDNMRSLAHLTLSAEAQFQSPSYTYASSSSNGFTPASQRERLSTDSYLVGQDSFVSDDEAMAREMEQILDMDTPTRAEFVISPTGSEATTLSARTSWSRLSGNRPLSRASSAGSVWHGKLDKKVSASTIASRRSAATSAGDASESSEDTLDGYTFGKAEAFPTIPPVPDVPLSMRRPVSQNFAHPFPVHNTAASIPLPLSYSNPIAQLHTAVSGQTHPIAPHPSMHSLNTRKSAETIRSESTDQSTPPVRRHQPEWRISRQELKLVKELQERKVAMDEAAAEAEKERLGRVEREVSAIETRARIMGITASPPSPEKRKGLKPLKLVGNRPASVLGPRAMGTKAQVAGHVTGQEAGMGGEAQLGGEVSVVDGGKRPARGSSGLPMTPSRKKVSRGGSAKENLPRAHTPGSRKTGKESKGSTGPGMVSGLRA